MITFRLTEDDLVAGNTLWRKYQGKDPAVVIAVVVAWGAMSFYLNEILEKEPWTSVIVGLLAGIGMVTGVLWAGRIVSRRKTLHYFRTAPSSNREELTVDWDADHISFSQGESYGKMKWSDLRHWSDDDRIIVLLRTGPIFYAIPKRALSAEQLHDIHACMETAGLARARDSILIL